MIKDVIITFVRIFIIFSGVMLTVAYLSLFERKWAGRIQVRYGPMRCGGLWGHGWLQPFADGLKLFIKEDIIPTEADAPLFVLSPIIILTIAIVTFTVIPFAPGFIVSDLNIGILFILSISSLGIYGIVMAGWSSNNKYSLLGGLRSAAQMLSYEIPLGLSVISGLMFAGSLSMVDITNSQTGALFRVIPAWLLPRWIVFYQPIAFFIFLICMLAETNRLPFDLPEAESELVAGFHVEYSGMKFSMFFMAEYTNMILVSAVAVTLFLGGWNSPTFPLWLVMSLPALIYSYYTGFWRKFFTIAFLLGTGILLLEIFGDIRIPIFWFVIKIIIFLFWFIWVRWTYPRYRYDQLMKICWYFLLPLALINIIVTGFIKYLLM
jgi:NADH-quinone oxidoreductase subunit H